MNTTSSPLNLNDFDYVLPVELIAQLPQDTRSASRLLHIDQNRHFADKTFIDLIDLLKPHDLLVFNNTRVIKARLHGHKATGGAIEVLIERVTGLKTALAHIKASKSPPIGTELILAHTISVRVVGRLAGLYDLLFEQPVLNVLDQHGEVPLPPYIQHSADDTDAQRYQTIYAKIPGAVAAPTAGLHFDENMLLRLQERGVHSCFVTLHVGAGTFQPVRDNDLSKHVMHSEWFSLSPETVEAVEKTRQLGGRVVAVGTTSVRALESSAKKHDGTLTAYSGDTQLFIKPGFDWQVVDAMVTNFHLPQSTLLMLVSAFIGLDTMKAAYSYAIAQRYRFFSYGDAMFLEKGPQP